MNKPDFLHGFNSVYAALKAGKRKFERLYLSAAEEGLDPKSTPRIQKIFDHAVRRGIKTFYVAKE